MTWIQTYTGVQFWPLAPKVEDVRLEDIAHALSNMCRFNGHCREFYSVAQHSVHVAEIVASHGLLRHASITTKDIAIRTALMHDAAEAYLPDVTRPIKSSLSNFHDIETRLLRVIFVKFAIPSVYAVTGAVKHCDNVLLATEMRDLLGDPPAEYEDLPEPSSRIITGMLPNKAKEFWLEAWLSLQGD